MIYTKKGDDGTTSLVGGTRVKKYDDRVECYGEIDHLVSLLGFAGALMHHEMYSGDLFVIQSKLFEIEAELACENKETWARVPHVEDVDVAYLERKIDAMETDLAPMKGFIIPTSSRTATSLHVCRTQTRRCERMVVKLSEQYEINPVILRYLNRLSDYLFDLARMMMKQKNRPEKYWKGKNQ